MSSRTRPKPDIASRAGLRLAGWLLAAALAACQPAPVKPPPNGPAAPLKLGLQAYTFRQYSFAETLDLARGLGLHYVQAFPGQTLGGGLEGSFGHRLDMAARTRIRALLAAADVRLVSYGVVTGKDEADWRQIFAFARDMGLENIASEPARDDLALVDRLSRESGVAVAIHNHPPPARYYKLDTALAAVAPYGPNLGICADTGHWVRSGDDPVVSLRRAAGRILAVHFKDLDERGVAGARDVPWGTGVANAAGQLAELRRQRFSGVIFIEYEHATPSLLDDVARCIQFFKRAALASDADLAANRVLAPGYTTEISDTWEGNRGRDSLRWPQPQALFAPDLSNARISGGSWAWQGDLLLGKGNGAIWTQGERGDFVVSLEFRCAENSAGAVVLRGGPDRTDPPLAVRIRPSGAADRADPTGAIAGWLAPAREVAIVPGQWHGFVITASGGHLRVMLDGGPGIEMNLDDWKEPGRNPDGSANPFDRAGADLPRRGRIGLRCDRGSIAFRHILIEGLLP